MTTTALAPDPLIEDVAAVFRASGLRDAHAHLVADTLVRAEMWGHRSHGLLRVPWYINRVRSGVIDAVSDPEVIIDGGAFAVVDAHDGVGQVVADWSVRDAVARAREHGVGIVSVRNSNHFGTAAYFTRIAAELGCVSLLVTNSSPAMAPWGGREKVFGANPWSIAAPAGRYGVSVMDISNTTVARGKIYSAHERGIPIPEGWAIDGEGRPTTDPLAALEGLVLPIGEHKGYVITFMMDVLAGVLSGSGSGQDVHGPQQAERRSECGHFVMALDVSSFSEVDAFAGRMERLIEQAKAVPLAAGASEIFTPGEMESVNEARAASEGVHITAGTLLALREVAEDYGVALRLKPMGD